MDLYDRLATVYDAALERTYREHRALAAEALDVPPGSTLLDVNLLVALAWPHHVLFMPAHRWFGVVHASGWVTTPITWSSRTASLMSAMVF